MSSDSPTKPAYGAARLPLLSYNAFFVGLRYLLRKKLCYLAVVGIALSVGTIIVVMSVFTGFQLKLTSVIRGYLSDMSIQPRSAGLHGHDLRDWELFREQVLEQEHVVGVAPFVQSVGLVRLPGTDYMNYVGFRGVEPALEPTVSELRSYMKVGSVAELSRMYATAEGAQLRACFVGKEFPGFPLDVLRRGPGQLILVTATRSLDRRLRKYAVNGVFETGNYEYDSQMVIMSLEAAMDLVDSRGGVTGLSVKLDDYRNAEKAREGLRSRLAWGCLLRAFPGGSAPPERVALSGDGSSVAVLTEDGSIVAWQAKAQEPLLKLQGESARPTAIALDYDGQRLLAGYSDGSAAVHQVPTGSKALNIPASGSAVSGAALSPDGLALALGYDNGTAALLDAQTGEARAALKGHGGRMTNLRFDGAGAKLLTLSAEGAACVWDATDGTLEAKLTRQPAGQEQAAFTAAALNRGGRAVLTGDARGHVVLWDAATGRPVTSWAAASAPVFAVGFGEGVNEVMTAARDGVSLWFCQEAKAGSTVQRCHSKSAEGAPFAQAVFSPNGARILTATEDGRVSLRYGGSGFHILTWEEQRKSFVEAVAMERFLMALILSLILVVAEFFIFAIVTTMVNERRRDIGIMKATGFTGGQICLVFLVVGLSIGVIGALLGVGTGLIFADNINPIRGFVKVAVGFDPFPPEIYYFKDIPTHVGPLSVLLTAGGAVVCSLIFSILPAVRAARMEAVETLRYE